MRPERQTLYTAARQRRCQSIYGGLEWYCISCDYSPGTGSIPTEKCFNCGAELNRKHGGDGILEVEIERTSYGWKRVNVFLTLASDSASTVKE